MNWYHVQIFFVRGTKRVVCEWISFLDCGKPQIKSVCINYLGFLKDIHQMKLFYFILLQDFCITVVLFWFTLMINWKSFLLTKINKSIFWKKGWFCHTLSLCDIVCVYMCMFVLYINGLYVLVLCNVHTCTHTNTQVSWVWNKT